jgi:hypothetical protein
MQMSGTCQVGGHPLIGTVRKQTPGSPWRESWQHINPADEHDGGTHSAHPADGSVGPLN